MSLRASVLRGVGKTVLQFQKTVQTVRRWIPTHLQGLLWFHIGDDGYFMTRTYYEWMNPYVSWESLGRYTEHPEPFPNQGYFLWIYWDAKIGKKCHCVLNAKEVKDVFHEATTLNDVFAWEDTAVLKRLHTFTYMDSLLHRTEHPLLDIHSSTVSIPGLWKTLRQAHLEESLYIPKNLTGAAVLWIYAFLKGTLPDNGRLTVGPLTLTDEALDERVVTGSQFLFE